VDAVLSATVGAPFGFVVTALDGSNNTVNSYTGTVHFTSSDGNAVLPKNSRLRNGVGNFSATLETSGSQTISATDTLTASITGTAIAVLVSGPATHFAVTSPTNATAGMAVSFTVVALDASNNEATGYTGTVHFTSTDGQAVLPANSILSIGVGLFSVTLNTAGSETITATDTVTPAITGTSNSTGVAVSRFKSAGDMETPRVSHTATLLSSAKVLIAGGVSTLAPPFAPLDTAELFDPTSASFAPTGTMTTARAGQTATLLNNGTILIAGGGGTAGALATAELYNPSTGMFTLTGSMTTARVGGHTATLLSNGKVLIAGGFGSAGDIVTAELFDPSTGMFTLTGSMTNARESHTATLLKNGTVLIAGGSDMGDALATSELYDPATGMFTLTGSMTTARESHTATLLGNGKVLMAGGNAGDPATAELYDPSTHAFTLTGSLTSVQRFRTATLLNDGTVLVTGGEYSTGTFPRTCKPLTFSSASAELYDPTNGTFTYTGNMAAQRVSHTATLLTNGEVLVTGGNQWIPVPGGPLPPDNCPSTRSLVVASAELFH
jgi:hypothetical protein